MSRGTKQRGFRCENELWDEATAAAEERGDNLSEILRQALRDYTKPPKPPLRFRMIASRLVGYLENFAGDYDLSTSAGIRRLVADIMPEIEDVAADAWELGADAEFQRSVLQQDRPDNPYRSQA